MAEWPKKLGHDGIHPKDPNLGRPVIPADLGRELYEALTALKERQEKGITSDRALLDSDLALARYEREVGTDG